MLDRTAASRHGNLSVIRLCYNVRRTQLIQNVDLVFDFNFKTIIMGANGAGKSLLLRLLHGLVIPSSGSIEWCGRPLDRSARRHQSMVFQRPVMMRRSVLANLRFVLAVRGIPKFARSELAQQALEKAKLESLANRPARVLSGGEQQRLAIAKALICSPSLLLLDEPSASLDPASTLAIEEMINTAHSEGVGVIMITHDAGQARRLADRVVFMHHGRVVETGTTSEVLDRPQSHAAQAWLGGRLQVD